MNILFTLLSSLYAFCALLLVLLILVQKGKGSLGIGYMGGSQQMLFGGAGGQDFLQKITWFLGAILMVGSLSLAILKSRQAHTYMSAPMHQQAPVSAPEPVEAE